MTGTVTEYREISGHEVTICADYVYTHGFGIEEITNVRAVNPDPLVSFRELDEFIFDLRLLDNSIEFFEVAIIDDVEDQRAIAIDKIWRVEND